MKNLEMISGYLLVLGGIVLGLEGLVNYDLLDTVLGADSLIERAVDVAIGAAAVYMVYKMAGMDGGRKKR